MGSIRRRGATRPATTSRGMASKRGLAPGTPVFIGERRRSLARVDLLVFDEHGLEERSDVASAACEAIHDTDHVSWINVNGVHDIELVATIGKAFDLHPMTLEDIVNTRQRPKCEEFPGYLFVAMKMLSFWEDNEELEVEHVSLIFGSSFVISFLEDEGDVFDSIRSRLRAGSGRILHMHADYLAYSLMDAIIDHYFLAVEAIGERVEVFDERMLLEPRQDDIAAIHRFKRELLLLRKAVWPIREVVSALDKSESVLLRPETQVFWRDLYDHTLQVIDMVETSRDILSSLHDTYLSSLSNRMNEVMKILTIISTIFIPLTFIVGVYGMNFEYMPELKWREGYRVVWLLMVGIGVSLFLYFKRRRWL
jgi:magnesium transporter